MKGSYTKVTTVRRCLRKAKYRYVDELEKVRKALPLVKGSLVHSCLEAHYTGKDWTLPIHEFVSETWNKLFEEEKEQYGDLPGDVYKIVAGYVRAYRSIDASTRTISTEKTLIVPSPSGRHELEMRIDRIVEDEHGLWVEDFKTCRTIPEENVRHTDLQTMLYAWGASKDHKGIMGTMINYIRTKPPSMPSVLKTGGMSRAAVDTDWHTYANALKQNGLDPSEYEDMKEKLRGKQFFKRSRLPINKRTLAVLLADLEDTLDIFQHSMDAEKFPRNVTRDCTWDCEYAPICFAELQGINPEAVIEEQYKIRGSKDDGEENDEEA